MESDRIIKSIKSQLANPIEVMDFIKSQSSRIQELKEEVERLKIESEGYRFFCKEFKRMLKKCRDENVEKDK